jgi:hypothetical protein
MYVKADMAIRRHALPLGRCTLLRANGGRYATWGMSCRSGGGVSGVRS